MPNKITCPFKNEKTLRYGMTDPITTDGPNSSDVLLSKKLKEYLKQEGMFETEEDRQHRNSVVVKIGNLLKQWIKLRKIESSGGAVRSVGLFRLGVACKEDGIEILCVAPKHIRRKDFFKEFYNFLKKQPGVGEIRAEPNSVVPLIGVKIDGVWTELFFASLALNKVPENIDLRNQKLLRGLDKRCLKSLNGFRVVEEILRQVPNKENFQLALQAVTMWAKGHGVYSNISGYLGGVPWAILVAKTCQLYPNAALSTLVEKFFFIFSNWSWPQPVFLKRPQDAKLKFRVLNRGTAQHSMPIITPAYPEENSVNNISKKSKDFLLDAFRQSLKTFKDVKKAGSWELFFKDNAQTKMSNRPKQELEQPHNFENDKEHLLSSERTVLNIIQPICISDLLKQFESLRINTEASIVTGIKRKREDDCPHRKKRKLNNGEALILYVDCF